jgi:protein SCO1/2
MRLVLALILLLLPLPAIAGLSESDLKDVELAPGPNARVPLDLRFRNANAGETTLAQEIGDRATLLLPVDYTCRMICGPALSIVASALARTDLRPGKDFRLVLVGLDPNSDVSQARAFADAQISNADLAASVSVLTGSAVSIGSLTQAIGYRYVRDSENNVFAHPTAIVALTSDGRVARTLSSLALDSTDLRLALIEAGEGKIGGVVGRLTLLCYGFDAVHGMYTSAIRRLLMIAAAGFLACLAAAIGLLHLRSRMNGVGT